MARFDGVYRDGKCFILDIETGREWGPYKNWIVGALAVRKILNASATADKASDVSEPVESSSAVSEGEGE